MARVHREAGQFSSGLKMGSFSGVQLVKFPRVAICDTFHGD